MSHYYSFADLCDSVYTPHVGIIDDDPVAAAVMRARVRLRFPICQVSIFTKPIVDRNLDIYFIDNDFDGKALGLRLLNKIRSLNPEAPVIIFSAAMDRATSNEFRRSGCDAVYNKNEPRDSEAAFRIVEQHIKRLQLTHPTRPEKVDREKKNPLRELLHQWSRKARHAGY